MIPCACGERSDDHLMRLCRCDAHGGGTPSRQGKGGCRTGAVAPTSIPPFRIQYCTSRSCNARRLHTPIRSLRVAAYVGGEGSNAAGEGDPRCCLVGAVDWCIWLVSARSEGIESRMDVRSRNVCPIDDKMTAMWMRKSLIPRE